MNTPAPATPLPASFDTQLAAAVNRVSLAGHHRLAAALFKLLKRGKSISTTTHNEPTKTTTNHVRQN